MKFSCKNIFKSQVFVIAAVCLAAVIMLVMTIVSAVNNGHRTDTELTLSGEEPTVIESVEGGTIIGTRGGKVIRKTDDNATVWEYTVESSGAALQDIAVYGEEVLCTTSGLRSVFALDLSTGTFLGQRELAYEPKDVAVSDEYVAVNTHFSDRNRVVVFARTDGHTDFDSYSQSDNTLPELTNIEFTETGIFGLGTDSNAYLFDPNAIEYPQVLFSVTSEQVIYMTPEGDIFSGVTRDGNFVEFDREGKVVGRVNVGGSFDKVASTSGHIVAVSTANKVVYFHNGRAYTVSAGCNVSRLMISSQAAYLIDTAGGINIYDFERIMANNTWKVLLPVFASLLAVGIIGSAVVIFLGIPATRAKTRDFFRRLGRALWRYKKIYLFLLLPFTLIGVFGFFPVIWGFVLAFTSYVPGLKMEWVGIQNFITAIKTPSFLGSTGNMLIFLVADLIEGLVPCFILAEIMFVLRMQKVGYTARVLTVLPGILPGVALVYIWTSGIYGSNGLINMVLQSLGFSQFDFNWLANYDTARNALLFYGFPFLGSYIMLYSALRSLPDSLLDAAKLDGCNKFRRVFMIDLPLLTPQMKYIFVTTFIASLQNFGRSFLTTGGEFGTMIPSLEIYYQINKYFDYGVAAAMSIMLFVVIFIATMLNQKIKTESIY